MFFRSLVISLLILVTVAASLPFGESLASYGRRAAAARSGKKQARRRSRAWWRRRRAQLRRQRAVAAARRRRRQRAWVVRGRRPATARRTRGQSRPQNLRALLAPMKLPSASPSVVEAIQSIEAKVAAAPQLAAPQLAAPQLATAQLATPQLAAPQLAAPRSLAHAAPRPLPVVSAAPPASAATPVITAPPAGATATPAPATTAPKAAAKPTVAAKPSGVVKPLSTAPVAAAIAPQRLTGLPVPRSWQNVSSTLAGEFKFSVRTPEGRPAGAAVWSRVAAPASASLDRRNKTLGGVSLSSLRRTVIDRMIAEGGWVVNDVERVVGGRRVFVVFAQSEGERGARRNWTYYFTESDGLVYSLATTTSSEFADAVASEAEQTIAAIAARPPATAQKH